MLLAPKIALPSQQNCVLNYAKEDFSAARALIEDEVINTPLVFSEYFSDLLQAQVFFKCENLQKAGAFKYRGATHAVRKAMQTQKPEYVATHSSGNHGRALAKAAKKNGIKALIVVPENAPKIKVDGMKREGAELFFCEPNITAREQKLKELLETREALVVPPYNHPDVILGQSTCAQEIIEALPDVELIICPVGGGGLLSGTALAAKFFGSGIEVYAGEPLNADDAYRSLQSGKIEPVGNPQTIADGLRTSLGSFTFEVIRKEVKAILRVSEEEITDAMRLIWQEAKLIVEPSCAVPVAALLKNKSLCAGKKLVVILSGGNVDLDKKYF